MTLPTWGYPNGQIPASAMVPIPSRGGTFYLKPDAAQYWLLLATTFQAKFGVALDITDGYRDLAEQQYYWDAYQAGWGNVASPPGGSNHGVALAVDIYTPSYNSSTASAQFQWLLANAPSYGWTWTTGQASGESWHWEFTTTPTIAISKGTNSMGTVIYDGVDGASARRAFIEGSLVLENLTAAQAQQFIDAHHIKLTGSLNAGKDYDKWIAKAKAAGGTVEVGTVNLDNTEVLKRLDALPAAIATAFFAEQKKAGN